MQAEPIQSLPHPLELFGYTAHALMIPPFAPANVLILGYGLGTVHRLIEQVWGPVNVTGVDMILPDCDLSDVTFVHKDAMDFARNYQGDPYDYVVVDLFNGKRIPAFVFDNDFAYDLKKLTLKILSVNATFYNLKDFANFGKVFQLDCLKRVNCGQGSEDEDKVMFFRTRC